MPSFKPDHSLVGTLTKGKAHGIRHDNDKLRIVLRKQTQSLSTTDIYHICSQPLKQRLVNRLTQEHFPLIENEKLNDFKQRLNTVLKERGPADKVLEKELAAFVKATGIERVRVFVIDSTIKSVPSAPYKGYAIGGYAYSDVWQIPLSKNKTTGEWRYKFESILIPYAEAKSNLKNPRRPESKQGPHPAAKRIMRLYKNDCIEVTPKKR